MKQKLNEIKNNKEADKEYSLVLEVKEIYRTTDGLNIFTVGDGESLLKLTKFVPGKALYEELKAGNIKEFKFKIKIFQNEVQGDLLNVIDVNSELINKFKEKNQEQQQNKYAPKDETLLIETKTFIALKKTMLSAASEIRKAVVNKRPIHITHHGDCDGFSAGILLEQSIISLIQKYHPHERYVRQYIGRNSSRPPYYDIADATKDIGFFLGNTKRFGVTSPLIIIVDNGSTKQDLQSIEKVQLFGADVLVIDHHDPGVIDENGESLICKHTLSHVNPHLVGRTFGISASMLCYQVAYYINEKFTPNVISAVTGGVADRCEGEEIDALITQSTKERDYLRKLAKIVDYEIYLTKMNLQAGGIYTLLTGTDEERNKLITLYEPLLFEAEEGVKISLKKYSQEKMWGNHKIILVNGDQTTLWGDYFTIGKLAGITFDLFSPMIVIVHTDSMMVFRAQQESAFDVNKLLSELKININYARITGGGHAVAGSIKFLSAAKKDILTFIQKKLEE